MGQAGLTDAFLQELKNTLSIHELIKVKLVAGDKTQRDVLVNSILNETNANKIQVLGNTLTLYHPSEEKKISLPGQGI